jgi:poly(hydroxyalkanoate) depolymerase family esterase
MKTTFVDAMLHATELTRAQNLLEATRQIQIAVRGASPPDERRTGALLLDAPSSFSRSEANLESSHAPAKRNPLARVRRPLRETVELLRKAKLPGAPSKRRVQPTIPKGAAYLSRNFSCAAGSRDYKIFLPSRLEKHAPLIVMLHGCTQGPDDFSVGTRMNDLAEESGFIVVYPEQTTSANNAGCWNWFNHGDQIRDMGEPSIIAGITRSVIAEYDVDPSRVFIAGLSAGGAMTVVMGATYPELYAATGVHSGLAFGAATDVISAFAAMRGSAPRAAADARSGMDAVRTIVFHGTADHTVHPSNGELIFTEVRSSIADAGRISCTEDERDGRMFRRTIVADATGIPLVEHWEVCGLGHAWSGGDSRGSYTDVYGPNASREMVRFFLERQPSD